MPGSFFLTGLRPAYISSKLNSSGRIVTEEVGALWSAYDRPVTSRTGFAIVPGQQMSHQLINFLMLAPRQLGVFGKRQVSRPSNLPRLLKRGKDLFPELF
jgi:hypothetical protein